jgi:two-component system, OmpR family, sensor histidine kinase VanS
MIADDRPTRLPRVSARLRLTLSYAVFLVAAGIVMLAGVYVVLRYVPDYPRIPFGTYDGAVYSRQEILDALSRVSVVILVLLAVIGGSGGWVLAGWVLRPLQRINEAARIAATGRLDHRIRLVGRNDEFRQLADTFDHMLDRLHDAFNTQERFAANASHELRTPLAVNAALLDVARLYPDAQHYPTLIERLSITNTRAINLTEALLRLADANSITATAEPVDLARIAHAAIADAATEAEHHRVQIDTHLEFAPTSGDATLLEQLATNLIQNAIRHNHSPGDARVTTSRDPRRDIVTLRVENTGNLYTPEQVAQLSEPFLRGNGRINRPGQARGYGLGLALVSRITTIHDGTLALMPGVGGGLIVTVTLPVGRSIGDGTSRSNA